MRERDRRHVVDRPVPMVRVSDRTVTPAEAGPVYVFDIDKTYLDTRFSQVRGLASIPFEFGIDKRAVPGAPELLRGLRAGPDGRDKRPLYFVTASPPQLAYAVERKMLVDGVEWDGITYKDWARFVLAGRAGELREQVGFKLSALLLLARELPSGCRLHLFGDDYEKDATSFAIAADVLAGRLRGDALSRCLTSQGVRPPVAKELVFLAEGLPPDDLVAGVHIRTVREPDGSAIAAFPPSIAGYPTWGSCARRLGAQGLLSQTAVQRVVDACPPSEPILGSGHAAKGAFVPSSMHEQAGWL